MSNRPFKAKYHLVKHNSLNTRRASTMISTNIFLNF
uniref:Uncharacterized protein n=1 Tax=Anguilla anguilla TaxID=7936 RepID=A0A0E9TXZ8_ANGAN